MVSLTIHVKQAGVWRTNLSDAMAFEPTMA
jgi:hypothetical protein